VRIPLDYYRILSVPVNKATLEQLEQAYHDRLQQQPRREYSDRAIKARQELIEHSYQVLSDIEQRAVYDAQFLVNMQPMATSDPSEDSEPVDSDTVIEDSATPVANSTIEIPESQLVGALSIFHELGEYELVLRIGIDFYNSQQFAKNSTDELSVDTTKEDLILSLALAYLELGREQWHRREYEYAAISGQMGVDLLEQENLFPKIRAELESDLDKLRPYRVLELISQNSAESKQRARGFELLRSMLIQRQGIESKERDRSGMSFNEFLCFVQQLRTYLTSAEQQQLFDDESLNDSAIANYLAVYALLGRGFSLKQPELVLRAQRKLDGLSDLQDVSWEQTVAALLLGHTEKAMHRLKNSSDTTKLEQVEQYSASSIDLLPGLCFYGEKWLREDVIGQFSDLTAKLTLKEYFGDRQVQNYLEQIDVPAPAKVEAQAKADTSKLQQKQIPQPEVAVTGIKSVWRSLFPIQKPTPAKAKRSRAAAQISTGTKTSSGTATIERDYPNVSGNRSRSSYNSKVSATPNSKNPRQAAKSLLLPLEPEKTRAVPTSVIQKTQGISKKRVSRKKKPNKATFFKGWLFILGLFLGPGAIVFLTIKLLLSPNVRTANNAQLAVALNRPAVELPPKTSEPVAVAEPTFAEKSTQTIQAWLDSKSAAFGKEHQIERLNTILAEPLLSTWRDRAMAYKQGNFYREYEHNLTVRSATVDPNNQNKATIEAEVKEIAKHYQSGKLDDTQSYNDNLLVRYQVVRQKDKWVIQNAEVLKTL
jgi:curved DNA-binding protein CbpA